MTPTSPGVPPLTYPKTARRADLPEDPYRDLEAADAPATQAWVKAQNTLTEAWLGQFPRREALRRRLNEIMDYPRASAPSRRGGRYFQFKNHGLENQDRLLWRPTLDGPETELLDPNKLSGDGTIALLSTVASPDGGHLAYMYSRAGSDWAEIRVRVIATLSDLPDVIAWVKFSTIAWSPDGRGFYYSRYDAPAPGQALAGVNRFQKLYFHALGATQDRDRLVHERPDDGTIGTNGQVTDDGRYLVLTCWHGAALEQQVHVIDLATPEAPVRVLVGEFTASFHFVGNDGDRLYFKTTLGAGRGRLVGIDAHAGMASLTEVIPETSGTLEQVYAPQGCFVGRYLEDAASTLKVFRRDGRWLRDIPLPGVGAVQAPALHATDTELFFLYESFATPPTVYRVALPDGTPECQHRPVTRFDQAGFETRRVMVESPDGTRLPVFLSHRKGLQLDGENPTLLYGYGGFNMPVLPWFRTSRLAWMELGGVFASACLRGGGEYGEDWYRAGTRERKQNVFDDFTAVAKWLASSRYTRPGKLAINGGSNGGLLVGACLTQHPELFGAAVAAVGVFDMLRFHKFTIGWGWRGDYGDPDVAADATVLRQYSPLHNIKQGGHYPPTLLTTADHDDRVVPAHSYKFAAALQAAQAGPAPILLRVDINSGHGLGKPTSKLIDETADIYTFLCATLGVAPASSPP